MLGSTVQLDLLHRLDVWLGPIAAMPRLSWIAVPHIIVQLELSRLCFVRWGMCVQRL